MPRVLHLTTLALCAALPLVGAQAEPQAEATLKSAFNKLRALKSYSAQLQGGVNFGGRTVVTYTGTVQAMKPLYLKVVKTQKQGDETSTTQFVSNGKDYIVHSEGDPSFGRDPVNPGQTQFQGQWEGEIDAFFGGEKLLEGREVTSVGEGLVGKISCVKIRAAGSDPRINVTYFVGKADQMIHRSVIEQDAGGGRKAIITQNLTAILANPPLKNTLFAFKPPAGVRERYANMVPVGKAAPDFLLPALGGGEVGLEKTLKEKKAVLVNFWFYN